MNNFTELNRNYGAPSVFTPGALLREARRQKHLSTVPVPAVCVLDPDGDIARRLRELGTSRIFAEWPCYHTELLTFVLDGRTIGLVPCAVGGPFAVLVAEELFEAGCEFVISITSAGLLAEDLGRPPFFVLIDAAWRDEGTSLHYVPPAEKAQPLPEVFKSVRKSLDAESRPLTQAASWTTDAPFRETDSAIRFFRDRGAAVVEMEAAALYSFSVARDKPVICFAYVTNQMAVQERDFEKGIANGADDALEIIRIVSSAWRRDLYSNKTTNNHEVP